jgi:hypothetical protein
MWARPGGERVLVAATEDVAAFVSAVYRFDDTVVDPAFRATITGRTLRVEAPGSQLAWTAEGGRGWPVPIAGPPWVTRRLAGPVARRAMGVNTYGVSPTGVREWYRASWYRPVLRSAASIAAEDLGALAPLDPPVRFGFSEPPKRPSMVSVRPLLHDPGGHIGRALAV